MRTRLVLTTVLATGLLAPFLVATPAASTGADPLRDRDRRTAMRQADVGHSCNYATRPRCGHIRVPLDRAKPNGRDIRIAYELFPRRMTKRLLLGTIVAVEGGPGYSTTGSRAYYRDLFGPLLDRRQLLLVDNRGTGKSEAIRCRRLQSYKGSYVRAVGECGRQLGRASDVYGSAVAAQDMVAVLNHLGIDKVDLYGDSYGTFFSQTFAVRHPDRVRTVMLDAAYFVAGTDPWYSDTNRAVRDAFRLACRRSPSCAERPGGAMQRLTRLARQLRQAPIRGRAPNADGEVRPVVVDLGMLIDLLTGGATSPTVYRELDAAARAAMRAHPYTEPLLRLAREVTYVGSAGRPRWFSEGLYDAVACNDYPQPYDMTAPPGRRPEQYQGSVRGLASERPNIFAPFSVREWVSSPYGYYRDCIKWPVPSRWVHAVPRNATFPDIPTLVIAGDLDSLTSPEGARATARAFPDSTYVRIANGTHVAAVVDFDQCASRIVRRFVRSTDAGDTSCASEYHENRLVDRFVRSASQLDWAGGRRRTARVAAATVADVVARWLSMSGRRGVGLQGGHFTARNGHFTSDRPVVRFQLHNVRWVKDVAVSGGARWHRRSGLIEADVRIHGPGAVDGSLQLRWNDLKQQPRALAIGRLGGERVRARFPAP